MGIFSKLFKKTTSDIVFEKVEPLEVTKLENQNGVIDNCTYKDVENFLQIMFANYDQFITLSVPSARYGIRFVQACRVNNGIDVELGLEENNHTKVICKVCTEAECSEVFREFFTTANVYDKNGYEPLQIRR